MHVREQRIKPNMSNYMELTRDRFRMTRMWGMPQRVIFRSDRGQCGSFQFDKCRAAPGLYKTNHVGLEKIECIDTFDRMIRETEIAKRNREARASNLPDVLKREETFFKHRLIKLQRWVEEDGLNIFKTHIDETKRALESHQRTIADMNVRRSNGHQRTVHRQCNQRGTITVNAGPFVPDQQTPRRVQHRSETTPRRVVIVKHVHPGKRHVDALKEQKQSKRAEEIKAKKARINLMVKRLNDELDKELSKSEAKNTDVPVVPSEHQLPNDGDGDVTGGNGSALSIVHDSTNERNNDDVNSMSNFEVNVESASNTPMLNSIALDDSDNAPDPEDTFGRI